MFRKRKKHQEIDEQHLQKAVVLGLLASLRRRLPENSPLLPTINDYSLFLRLDEKDFEPVKEVFDLTKVADRAIASVKKLYTAAPGLHAMVSVKSGTPRNWNGNSEVVESLFRNLLLATLSYLRSGIVYLRIEHEVNELGANSLLFTLEDTSGKIPHSAWQNKVMGRPDMAIDLSWPLVLRIFQKTGGSFRREESEKGICLTGYLPLKRAGDDVPVITKQRQIKTVLMVEDDRSNSAIQKRIFEMAGYNVFISDNGVDALEWASVLPFSLILLDSMLPGISGPVAAARLGRMKRDGVISNVTIAALTANDSVMDREAWKKAGVEHILLKPLAQSDVEKIKVITAEKSVFYLDRDVSVDGELLGNSIDRLEGLQKELENQVRDFSSLLSNKFINEKVIHAAHAVKSASLSLGFYRLSGLAAAIEHAIKSEHPESLKDNLPFIRQCLFEEFGSSSLQNELQDAIQASILRE